MLSTSPFMSGYMSTQSTSMKPMEDALTVSGAQPHSAISAAMPGRLVWASDSRPLATNTRFSPCRGMTSATVPRQTMSAYSSSTPS